MRPGSAPGKPVRISLDALPRQSFPGKVKRVAPYVSAVEKQARTVDIEATFTDPAAPGKLLVGYSADIEVILAVRENVIRVPSSALLDGGRVLVAAANGRLAERQVKTGLANWEFTEVLEGLTAGEQVVTSLERAGVSAGAHYAVDHEPAARQVVDEHPPDRTGRHRAGFSPRRQRGARAARPRRHHPAGEYVAVMGPSGSGKSTLLNLLGLLDRPDVGSYRLEGRDVTTLSAAEQARVRSERIGFVFQSFHLVPRLTAAENIALPMILAGIRPAQRAERVARALRDYGLENRSDHRPDQLSGGQRQRVAIARATIMQPALILADEPTGNLDRATGEEVMRLLEELNQGGVTLIVVTHDGSLGARARRQLLMEDGALQQDRWRSTTPANDACALPT
jgi:putative ABC transport system ATP-binding protein